MYLAKTTGLDFATTAKPIRSVPNLNALCKPKIIFMAGGWKALIFLAGGGSTIDFHDSQGEIIVEGCVD